MILQHRRAELVRPNTWVVISALVLSASVPLSAHSSGGRTLAAPAERTAESVRTAVARWGVGKEIDVRTRANLHLRGTIDRIEADGFTIRDTRQLTRVVRIPYGDVRQITRTGLPLPAKIAILGGVAVGASFGIWLVKVVTCRCG